MKYRVNLLMKDGAAIMAEMPASDAVAAIVDASCGLIDEIAAVTVETEAAGDLRLAEWLWRRRDASQRSG